MKATLSVMAERNKIGPWGLQGGHPGSLGVYRLIKTNGDTVKLPSKFTVEIREGDTLVILTPGGGGYGDPRLRTLSLSVGTWPTGSCQPSPP